MNIYTALLKHHAEPVLVPESFAWGALCFGPLWLAAHRAWVAAALSLAAGVLIGAVAPAPANIILTVGLALVLGLTGHDLRRWALEHRGYLLTYVFAARDRDEALMRLLAQRPDVAARYRPEPG